MDYQYLCRSGIVLVAWWESQKVNIDVLRQKVIRGNFTIFLNIFLKKANTLQIEVIITNRNTYGGTISTFYPKPVKGLRIFYETVPTQFSSLKFSEINS